MWKAFISMTRPSLRRVPAPPWAPGCWVQLLGEGSRSWLRTPTNLLKRELREKRIGVMKKVFVSIGFCHVSQHGSHPWRDAPFQNFSQNCTRQKHHSSISGGNRGTINTGGWSWEVWDHHKSGPDTEASLGVSLWSFKRFAGRRVLLPFAVVALFPCFQTACQVISKISGALQNRSSRNSSNPSTCAFLHSRQRGPWASCGVRKECMLVDLSPEIRFSKGLFVFVCTSIWFCLTHILWDVFSSGRMQSDSYQCWFVQGDAVPNLIAGEGHSNPGNLCLLWNSSHRRIWEFAIDDNINILDIWLVNDSASLLTSHQSVEISDEPWINDKPGRFRHGTRVKPNWSNSARHEAQEAVPDVLLGGCGATSHVFSTICFYYRKALGSSLWVAKNLGAIISYGTRKDGFGSISKLPSWAGRRPQTSWTFLLRRSLFFCLISLSWHKKSLYHWPSSMVFQNDKNDWQAVVWAGDPVNTSRPWPMTRKWLKVQGRLKVVWQPSHLRQFHS